MIDVTIDEYRKGDYAVRDIVVTFFKIPIYRYRKTSSNNVAVRQLTIVKQNSNNIKGFNK